MRAGPEGQRLRVVEREIRPAGPQLHALFLCRRRRRRSEIDRDLSEFTHLLIAALGVLGLGLVAGDLVPGALRARAAARASARTSRAIRSGEAERLEGELPDEIRPLQQELNALIQSNREIVERARTHVGNLAHALKTPLSVITNEARDAEGAARAARWPSRPKIMRTQITHHLDRARVAARSSVIGDTTDVDGVLQGTEAGARPHL